MQTVKQMCRHLSLLGVGLLVGCATLTSSFEAQLPDVTQMELTGDSLHGCASPFTPDLWKHTYRGPDVDVVVFGKVVDPSVNDGEHHGPILAALVFTKGSNDILKAVVQVRGVVRVFQNREELVAAYPGPCDILAANSLTSV